ncbi:MAG: hypothetical protein J5802_12950 [Butyrivibrio sp.]|nr:hypothetical protein [Butyrivibrio sp.]
MCGKKLFEDGKSYLIQVACIGHRTVDGSVMMLFVDEKQLYEVKAGETICFSAKAGFHTLKFRQKIRSKSITLLVNAGYAIKVSYNSVSGLIETNTVRFEDDEDMSLAKVKESDLTQPVMVSEIGVRGFDSLLGVDEPEFEVRATEGLKEGVLSIYSERLEFKGKTDMVKDIVEYKSIVSVKKKMGTIDILCDGNAHKIYSIPKDAYNDVMSFLNNKIEETRGVQ